MKKKFTLSIADMEINVITDEPQEFVEHIVGILDRKMREFALKSKRCTKNEAALLCALEFCADKLKQKEQIEELEDELESKNEKLANLSEKMEYVQQHADRAEKERARLEGENEKLRTALDAMRAGNKDSANQIAAEILEKAVEIEKPVGDVYAAMPVTEEAPAEEKPAEEKPAQSTSRKKTTGKSRVGSMFDLLTFSDI